MTIAVNEKNEGFCNLLRCLTMLEKAVDRLLRSTYFDKGQYPPIFPLIEEAFRTIRVWIENNREFDGLNSFYSALGHLIEDFGEMVKKLLRECKPGSGKRHPPKHHVTQQQERISYSINSMLKHVSKYLTDSKADAGIIEIKLEGALAVKIYKNLMQRFQLKLKDLISKRGTKTYIFPWADKKSYEALVNDKKKYRAEVVNKLGDHPHTTGHLPNCKGHKEYKLCGFRQNDRKTIMSGGVKEVYLIRMVKCKECGQRFSLLPSFLPREKNFGIEIIGHVYRNMFLFQQSFNGIFESLKLMGTRSVKSRQTLFNWLRWTGTHHPATILTRAGVKGTGYFQEDEGFEKEPNLRTYSVIMVDPKTHLVWHSDYVDHVDEKTLCVSFEQFLERISFKVIGVSKDKWQASTNALKKIFHKVWIGYCHRHCLKNIYEALIAYKKETKCDQNEINGLYKKIKKELKSSCSKISLKVRLNTLCGENEAFRHPLLEKRVLELKKNAVHYTAHKNRKGITQTTSIVDNYLKIVKRKLKQIESFRDKKWTQLFFQAQATIRNFVPYCSGAKNAHKSPFMLAGGTTYDLPWIQAMNMHNAFLFTENAS